MTPATIKKMRQLANALSAEDLRGLAIEVRMPKAVSRQLSGLVDALIIDHHDGLELPINEVAIDFVSGPS